MRGRMGTQGSPVKSYDYLLKFLLVGDSDVGKGEILESLQDGASESPYAYSNGIDYKTTTILLDGRRVKLELCSVVQSSWHKKDMGTPQGKEDFAPFSDPTPEEPSWKTFEKIPLLLDTSSQKLYISLLNMPVSWEIPSFGKLCTSTPVLTTLGFLLLVSVDLCFANSTPQVSLGSWWETGCTWPSSGQVPTEQARAYAEKNCMTFFEVSPLCNFNVIESFTELSRIVLMRHGMEKIWRPNRVFSLQDLCCRAIVSCTPVHLIDKLPLPVTIKSHLKSFSMANGMNAVMMHGRSYSLASSGGGSSSKGNSLKRSKSIRPPQSPPQNCSRNNCKIS
ncbi:hypothetical protein DUI87_05570 [Hirundo rustica rustica]|uniref:SOCS box domain-containing protein n=1 Tax=Hirundo rustica rustica TaxID=333673 RepID=A0A3M0KYX4_HIRRU|nr:hypothetical protein DUI87_05570 [Hirundo rustica rustica]